MARVKSFKKSKSFKRRSPKKTLKRKGKKSLVKLIKSVVEHKVLEKKMVSRVVSNGLSFSPAINTTGEIKMIIPQVSQGLSDVSRIGDKITPTSLRVAVRACFSSAMEDARDLTVHVYFLTSKQVKTEGNIGDIPITQMLKSGTGVDTWFNGSWQNATYGLEPSNFTLLHHKKFRLSKGHGLPNSSVLADDILAPSKQMHEFTVSIPTPKHLLYGETFSTTQATNYAPFMVVGYVYNDSTDASVTVSSDVVINAMSYLTYVDA